LKCYSKILCLQGGSNEDDAAATVRLLQRLTGCSSTGVYLQGLSQEVKALLDKAIAFAVDPHTGNRTEEYEAQGRRNSYLAIYVHPSQRPRFHVHDWGVGAVRLAQGAS
jgi:hypothetical protein